MFFNAIFCGIVALATMAAAAAGGEDRNLNEFVSIVRESDISLTCERRGNPCLIAGPGNPEYDVLSALILAVLEQQEYGMDLAKVKNDKPDENFWYFDGGEWKLDKPESAKAKRDDAKKKHDEELEKLQAEWEDNGWRRDLAQDNQEEETAAGENEQQEIERLDAFVQELFGSEYDEEAHSVRRRLYSCSGYCDMMCTFFCGRKRRRQLRGTTAQDERANKAEMERRAKNKASRELYFGENSCIYYTTLKEFLHKFPTYHVDRCVTDKTWCMLSSPCSI